MGDASGLLQERRGEHRSNGLIVGVEASGDPTADEPRPRGVAELESPANVSDQRLRSPTTR